jgi:hypothetical protein
MKGEVMNHTPDAVTADNGGSFDPQQAAALLDQTTQQARRQLQPAQPWLLIIRAVLVLGALGAIWFSVRGQHPYKGPTAADIPVLVGFIVVNFTATVAVRRRAIGGVSGRSRFTEGEIAVLIGSFVVTLVAMVGLGAAGASFAYYPTSVMVIPALAWTVLMVARSNWRDVAIGLAIVAVGIVGAFAGPAGSWAVAAVGLCLVMLGNAAVIIWQQHRSVVRP